MFLKGTCRSYILTLAPATGSQVFNKFVEHPVQDRPLKASEH
jgi:hypothetical protein